MPSPGGPGGYPARLVASTAPLASAPILLVVAAPAAGSGVEAALAAAEAAAAGGTDVRVLFTDAGLDCVAGAWPGRLRAAGAALALCARSARARGVEAAATPPSIVWSSLTTFFVAAPAGSRLWTLFP